MRKALSLAQWGGWILSSALMGCQEKGPRIPPSDVLEEVVLLDGKGNAGQVIELLKGYDYEADFADRFKVQIIYCRNLAKSGRVEEADSLYRRFISRSERIDHKWRLTSEYLILLAELRNSARMRQYADTLVVCCADSTGSLRDMSALHHFLAARNEGDCAAMRIWIDSMSYWAPRMKWRLPSDREIEQYRSEMEEMCR